MKTTALCLSLLVLYSSLLAQNIAINATGNQADPSAMLDVSSTSSGVLIPRMSATQRNAITSPAVGLQIFNTDCNEVNYWNGICWLSMGSLPAPGPVTSNSSTALCASVTAIYNIPAITGANGYIWSVPAGATINSGQGTTSINVSYGNYSGQICVTAYDNCESSEQRCIDINISPIPPTPGNITGLASVSPGQNLVTYFIASVSGAGVYNWSVPAGASITAGVGTPAITVSFTCSAVSGNVSVTAGSNCGTSSPSVLAITVTPLVVNAGSAVFGGDVIGDSPTASGGQTPYIYSWSPNSNLSGSSVANPTAQCSGSTTTYTVNVTDANGCSASSSVAVNRNLTANAGSPVLVGATINGSATGGVSPYTYSWSPNSNLSGYTVANPIAQCSGSTNTYTLTVNDANGCTATSSVTVTKNLVAGAGSNMTVCNGGSAVIGPATASGGNSSSYTFSWNPSTGLSSTTIANPTASPASTATYTVTVTDATGCTATSSMTLTVPVVVSTFTNSYAEVNNSVTFTPTTTSGVTYSWSFMGGSPASSTAQNPSVTWSSTGTYTVSLTVTSASTGCSSTASNTITVVNPTIVTFTNTGTTTWTVPSGVTSVQVLVVAGGGGGGGVYQSPGGGGGGGGGVIYNAAYPVSPGSITVTVGAGGTGGTGYSGQTGTSATNGSNSVFGTITAAGGGGGGSYDCRCSGQNGGSGGGESYGYGAGSGIPGQGNNGGSASGNDAQASAGGGGAGAAGGSPNSSTNGGGAGGAGVANSITGSSVYYGGGGGGGAGYNNGDPGGAGGIGGGGAGWSIANSSGNGYPGTANTGGGGGGGAILGNYPTESGGAGGSGIVIIAY